MSAHSAEINPDKCSDYFERMEAEYAMNASS